LKENKTEQYEKITERNPDISGPPTGIKQRILDLIFKSVGLKASRYMHGFKRGVYYAPIYKNTREFLRGDIELDKLEIHPRLSKDVQSVVDWWRPKAISRYRKLLREDRLNCDILYYNDLIGMDWETAKDKYLHDVGR